MWIEMFPVLMVLLLFFAGCAQVTGPPLDTVDYVDLDRYLGKWYEIASYPAPFQEGCVATYAEYSLREDGKIRVVNRCSDKTPDGPERVAEGIARVVDEQTNAKLKVSFFWPFEGDYWIIDLDQDYQWAVVGEPSRRFLWILSRTPTMEDSIYQNILAGLPEKNYDSTKLVQTQQSTD